MFFVLVKLVWIEEFLILVDLCVCFDMVCEELDVVECLGLFDICVGVLYDVVVFGWICESVECFVVVVSVMVGMGVNWVIFSFLYMGF